MCDDCTPTIGALYEDARQEALTELLGQVHCATDDVHADLDHCRAACAICAAGLGPSCPDCRAAV